jgi:hypothetical protein
MIWCWLEWKWVKRKQARPSVVARSKKGRSTKTQTSCYTGFVLKNMTITVSEEVAHWARKAAAEKNISVSKLVGRMLEEEMRRTDEYWKAYERFKKIKPIKGLDASKRLSRDELYDRGR